MPRTHIRECIPAELQHSNLVRNALHRLASQDLTQADEIKAIATDDESPIDSRLDAIVAVLAMESGEEAILHEVLNTQHRTVFVETLKSAATLRTQWALSELMTRLRTCDDAFKRALFAWALAAYPKSSDAEKLLREKAEADDDPSVREHAIESLGAFQSEQALKSLLAALQAGSARERFWALYSLGNLAPPEASDAIRKCLQDQTAIPDFGTISDEAARALAKIRDRQGWGTADR